MLRKRFLAIALIVTLLVSYSTGYANEAPADYGNGDAQLAVAEADSSASNTNNGQGSDKKDISGEFPDSNIAWTLTNAGMLTINGEGVMDNFTLETTPWSEYNGNIKFLYISDGITSIGDYAFFALSELKSVYIPDSVEAIGESAFEKCDKLQEISLPKSLKTIGDNAFRYCSKIESVEIPASVTAIGVTAFSNCEKLKDIYVSSDNTKYSDIDGVLFNKDATELVSYPDGKNDKEYTLAESVIAIGDYAFDDCDSLKSINLGTKVETIGDNAFYGCSSIEAVYIPASVENIAQSAFVNGCDKLEEINVDKSNKYYSSEYGVLFDKHKTRLIRYPSVNNTACYEGEYDMPNSVKVIGAEAFRGCQTVELIRIYGGLQKIEIAAFMDFDSLYRIRFRGTIHNWSMVEKDILNEKLDEISIVPMEGDLKKEFNAKVGVTYYLKDFVDNIEFNESLLENLVVSSSNTDVATVEKDKMTAISEGETIITAVYIDNGSALAVSVKVIVTADGGSGNTGSFNLIEGEKMDLKDALSVPDEFLETLVWNSSNKNVVTVNNGVVTAVDAGKAVVIATVNRDGSIKYNIRCTINVEPKYTDESYFVTDGGVIKSYRGPDADVSIPPTIGGVTITEIGNMAFYYSSHVTKVEMPNSVKKIGDYAFTGCSALSNISLHEGITHIGTRAFSKCSSLIKMTIPSTVANEGYYWFSECSRLKTVVFAKGKKTIGREISNSLIKSVVIPSTVTEINFEAFKNCTELTSINIPNSVTHIGSNAFSNCYSLKTVTIGSGLYTISSAMFSNCTKLEKVTLGSKVVTIGANAFINCESLTEIVIPDSVKTIGSSAFARCYNLTNVKLGSGVNTICSYAFESCVSLESISLPQKLAEIQQYAFSGTGLKSISIPDSVTVMEKYAFSYCENLYEVTLGNGLTDISNSAFYHSSVKEIVIPETVTYIGASAFSGCNELTRVILNNVEEIGNYAFYRCNSLTQIQLPETLTKIGAYAFGYSGLTSVVIPDSVKSMGSYVFYGSSSITDITIGKGISNIAGSLLRGCDSIKNVILSDGIKTISNNAFEGCNNLESIDIPDTVTSIGYEAFYNCSALKNIKIGSGLIKIDNNAFYGCRSLEEIKLPDSVTSIGSYAFYSCRKLKSIDIPDLVTYLGHNAFAYCTSLEQVDLSKSLRAIESYTFYNCSSLKEIVIPDSVESIYSSAFAYCSELSTVTFGANLSYFGSNVFYRCPKLSFTGGIPASLVKYILENNIFETGDLEIIYNYFDSENTSYKALNDDMVGYVEMELKYEIKEKYSPKEKTITVNLPQNAYLMAGTMMLNGQLLGEDAYTENENAQYDYNYITIPVEENSGVIKFCIKPTEYTKIATYAEMTMRISNRYYTEFIGYANCSLPEISISAPDMTGSAEVMVEGLTLPDSAIEFYIDGEHKIGKRVTSSRTGAYKTSITIDNPENYREYEIEAQVKRINNTSPDGYDTYSASTTVQYVSNTPDLEGFDMYYGRNGYTKTRYDLFKALTRPKIRWGDYMTGRGKGYSYYFVLDISNRELVDRVYVVSTRNNRKEYLEAVWNEYSQRYETSGYFANDCEYIPGVLTIEYVKGNVDNHLSLSDIGTYLNYDTDAFATSVTEYTADTYKAVVSVGEAIRDIFGDEFNVSSEKTYRDYSQVTEEELYPDKYNYYSYSVEDEDGQYVVAFDMRDNSNVAVYLHNITANEQTAYAINFASYDEEGNVGYVDVAEILPNMNEFSGKLLNVYDINIDTNKLVEALLVSGLHQEEIDMGITIADNLNIKKQMLVLMSTVLSASGMDNLSAPTEIIDCILGSITKDVSFFKERILTGVFRIGSESKIRWMIDPSGYVYEGVTDNRLEDVEVTAYYIDPANIPLDGDGKMDFDNINPEDAILWDATEHDQINPIITGETGEYEWVVPEGYYWQVQYKKDGYETAYSDWLPVPPPQMDVNVGLVSTAEPTVENVYLTTDYMVLTFDRYIKPDTLTDVKIGDASYTIEYDKTKTDLEGNNYANEFTFKFDESLLTGTDYTVSVDGAQSYAGVEMEAFTSVYKTPGEPLPKELILTTDANVNAKTIDVKYHNNTTSDMVINIACVTYDGNGDIIKIEMLGNESVKLGGKIDRGFKYDTPWVTYKVFTWYSSSLKPAATLFDSANVN